jgi:hypothetical protein
MLLWRMMMVMMLGSCNCQMIPNQTPITNITIHIIFITIVKSIIVMIGGWCFLLVVERRIVVSLGMYRSYLLYHHDGVMIDIVSRMMIMMLIFIFYHFCSSNGGLFRSR